MGYLKGYEFKEINKRINNSINLSKRIVIQSFSPYKAKPISKDLIIYIYDNKEFLEKIFINPRKRINIKSKYLSHEEINILNNYFNINGINILNYQLYKKDYKEVFV